MNKIISALHFPWGNIHDCCTYVKDILKIDGIEFSLDKSFNHPHLSEDDYKQLPALKDKYNLVAKGHIWENLAQSGIENGVEALLYWADLCHKSGINGIVIHGGSNNNQEYGLKCTKEIIKNVISQFEKSNIVLMLENHYAFNYNNCNELYSEPWEFIDIFNEIDSPSLRFCFDTGHGHMTKNGCELIYELRKHLCHVHLADNHGIDDDHCPYKQGSVPWDNYFKALKDINYDDTFCVEFPIFNDDVPFHQCIKDIEKIFI